MARGKSRLFGGTRGRQVLPSEDLIETIVVERDDLEFDTMYIESRQQYVYKKQKDTVEKVTFFKPKSTIVLNGRTVRLDGEDFLDFFMTITGQADLLLDMNSDDRKKYRKEFHKEIITAFQSQDWEDAIEKFKTRMLFNGTTYIRIKVDNSSFIPAIIDVRPLKYENVDVKDIVGFFREKAGDAFHTIGENELILEESNSVGYKIRDGYTINDSESGLSITPFIDVNNERFEFGTTRIYRSNAWQEDVTKAIMQDSEFLDDLSEFMTINARRPLKGTDDKFFKRVVKNLKGKLYAQKADLPKDLSDGILTSFEKNLQKFCKSSEFGSSNICIDVALNKSVSSYSFTPRVKNKVRTIMLKFSGDVQ